MTWLLWLLASCLFVPLDKPEVFSGEFPAPVTRVAAPPDDGAIVDVAAETTTGTFCSVSSTLSPIRWSMYPLPPLITCRVSVAFESPSFAETSCADEENDDVRSLPLISKQKWIYCFQQDHCMFTFLCHSCWAFRSRHLAQKFNWTYQLNKLWEFFQIVLKLEYCEWSLYKIWMYVC